MRGRGSLRALLLSLLLTTAAGLAVPAAVPPAGATLPAYDTSETRTAPLSAVPPTQAAGRDGRTGRPGRLLSRRPAGETSRVAGARRAKARSTTGEGHADLRHPHPHRPGQARA